MKPDKENDLLGKLHEGVWDKEFPPLKIDPDKPPLRTGSVRLRMGLYYTNEEYEKMRREILMSKIRTKDEYLGRAWDYIKIKAVNFWYYLKSHFKD